MYLYRGADCRPAVFHTFRVLNDTWCLLHQRDHLSCISQAACAHISQFQTELLSIRNGTSSALGLPVYWNVSVPWLPWTPSNRHTVTTSDLSAWFLNDSLPSAAALPELQVELAEAHQCIRTLLSLYPEYQGPKPNITVATSSVLEIRQSFIDCIAFLRWWMAWMPESLDSKNRPVKTNIQKLVLKWRLESSPSVGVVVDLVRDWQTANLPLWIEKGMRVYYQWSPSVSENPRFRHLSPALLSQPSKGQGFSVPYDGYFQDKSLTLPAHNGAVAQSMPWSDNYVIDFEGWKRRPISKAKAQEYFRYMPFFKIDTPKGERVVFSRWRPRSRPSCAADSDSEDSEDCDPMESEGLIREMFAWKYRPLQGNPYDLLTGGDSIPTLNLPRSPSTSSARTTHNSKPYDRPPLCGQLQNRTLRKRHSRDHVGVHADLTTHPSYPHPVLFKGITVSLSSMC